jgi:hypothetical protein
MVAPGLQEETMVANAEKAIDGAVQRINGFLMVNGKIIAILLKEQK